MKGKVFHIPHKPGMEIKRHRRKKCPDEYMELPPPPVLYEADPVMLAEIEEAGNKFLQSIEKYLDRMPDFWVNMVTALSADRAAIAIDVANESLLEEAKERETKFRMGVKLVKR